ncbi:MAG: TatD family hydrolase [Opitutaceae bacterium]
MTGLCDAHLHVQDPALRPMATEISDSWTRLGLVRAVTNATCEADWDAVAAEARRDARIIPAYGLHPWEVARRSRSWLSDLEGRLRSGSAVVGEIGLDHAVKGRDDAVQEEVFLQQLDLGYRLNLPVTIHCVRAWGRLETLLRDHRTRLPLPGFLLHAYGGPPEMINTFADLGARFSFSARAGLEPATRMRASLEAVPADRLLIETDAPALPPPPEWTEIEWVDESNGRRLNHPANILSSYRFVAGFLGIPLDTLVTQVRRNFEAIFGEVGE